MKLRDYQERSVRRIPGLLRKHRRVVAVAPTSSGKTVIGATFVMRRRGKRFLWLAHRIELLRQAKEELIAAGVPESDIGILSGPDKHNVGARILIASIGMFRSGKLPKVDFVVVDEAHRTLAESYRRILDGCDVPVLGLTATPWRLDGQGLGDVFRYLYVMAGPTELIADGYIAQPITYGIPKDKAAEMVKGLKRRKGDWSQVDLGKLMSTKVLVGGIVDEWERLARGVTTIVFAADRKHGQTVFEEFLARGYAVEYLDGETPDAERREMTKRLKSGETTIVVNIDVYSEGFDCPPVKCVVLARPTMSLTRFLQQTGRSGRPFGGRRPLVLDHAGNVWRHGLPETEHEWTLEGRKNNGTGEAPVKKCPACDIMMPTGCNECPECGEEQPKSEKEIEEERVRLERIRADEAERKRKEEILRKLAEMKGLGEEWVERAMEEAA